MLEALPQDVAVEAGHRRRIIGARVPHRHSFPGGAPRGSVWRASAGLTRRGAASIAPADRKIACPGLPHEDQLRRIRLSPQSGAVVVGAWEERVLTAPARQLDEATGGAVSRAVAASPRFHGKKNELLAIVGPPNLPLSRIVVAGLGKPDAVDARLLQDLGGTLVAHLNGAGESEATFALDLGDGASLEAGRCRRQSRLRRRAALLSLRQVPHHAETRAEAARSPRLPSRPRRRAPRKRPIARSAPPRRRSFFTRDLVSEPANMIYPETLAAAGRRADRIRPRGRDPRRRTACASSAWGRCSGSAQGSARPPRVVVMEHSGRRRGQPRRSASSARGSPSTPAASRSSRPPAWAR